VTGPLTTSTPALYLGAAEAGSGSPTAMKGRCSTPWHRGGW
jgi:hypothetical protein